ncbi:hypothetical protein C5E06_02215 [Pseudoclavibacter sp. RFBI5]|uniref:polysaccharide pyruvyl transferase family protein n=1 Tax=Pseudoclavibacter sp. RFBI5 TaxID=2080578 RepID=UPI000CE7E77E|nr:polysaccharide pyruvyl transferase family protein [Pseudoclavibacter sp. RFBI5]PPG05184.1 hypothetical protein C5E06_02215 [Pseudoclavibacter sp. RFBI5]
MAVKTFYWDPVDRTRRFSIPRRGKLRVGNAGDLFNRDLVRFLYDDEPDNLTDIGGRLLLVGSVIHRALPGDIVCGVGTKGRELPAVAEGPSDIRAVRGPLTMRALDEAGYDTSNVTSQLDPGLAVESIYAKTCSETQAEAGRVIFIPHYRDLPLFRRRREFSLVSIDCEPEDLVREILRAEFVYTSSLHGLIFAHALGRPVKLVAPVNGEPELKYQDYFASVDLPWSTPVSIDEALREPRLGSPVHIQKTLDDFAFPTRAELVERGIASASSA